MTKTKMLKTIIKAHKGGHRDVAAVFHMMFSHLFNATMHDGRIVLHHRENIEGQWTESHSIYIRKQLSQTVAKKFNEAAKLCFNKAFSESNELTKPKYVEIANNLLRIAFLLKNNTYKNHIVRECIELLLM